jgi:hypothetical protein
MRILADRGIALKTYREAKHETGKIYCSGREIDADTVIVYENFEELIEETGSLSALHEVATLWLCTAYVFCKCGQYHPVLSDVPAEFQLRDIIVDVYGLSGASFTIPSDGPDGFKIVYVLQIDKVSKKIDELNTWY